MSSKVLQIIEGGESSMATILKGKLLVKDPRHKREDGDSSIPNAYDYANVQSKKIKKERKGGK